MSARKFEDSHVKVKDITQKGLGQCRLKEETGKNFE